MTDLELALSPPYDDEEESYHESSWSMILKFNPYHDEIGRFTFKDRHVGPKGPSSDDLSHESIRRALGKAKVANPRSADASKQVSALVEQLAKVGLGVYEDGDWVVRTLTTANGGVSNSSLAKGLRFGVGLIAEVVPTLAPDVREALAAIKAKVFLHHESKSRTAGRAWIDDGMFRLNWARLGLAQNGKIEKNLGVYLYGVVRGGWPSFNISGKVWEGQPAEGPDAYDKPENVKKLFAKSYRSTIIHEIGHLLTSNYTVDQARNLLVQWRSSEEIVGPTSGGGWTGTRKAISAWIGKNISQYSTSQVTEFIAESFSKYHNGNYVKGSMPRAWEQMVEDMPAAKVSEATKVGGQLVITPLWAKPPLPRDSNGDRHYAIASPPFMSDAWFEFVKEEDQPSQSYNAISILKANPYHDTAGRFTSKDKHVDPKGRRTNAYANASAYDAASNSYVKRMRQISGEHTSYQLPDFKGWREMAGGKFKHLTIEELVTAMFGEPHPPVHRLRISKYSIHAEGVDMYGGHVEEITRGWEEVYGEEGDWVMYHSYFRVSENSQGKGIGTNHIASVVPFYKSLGFERIEVGANIDVGGYAWARLGFKCHDGSFLDAWGTGLQRLREEMDYAGSLEVGRLKLSHGAKKEFDLLRKVFRDNAQDPDLPQLITNIRTPKLDKELYDTLELGDLDPTRVLTTQQWMLRGRSWEGGIDLQDSGEYTELITLLDSKKKKIVPDKSV